jgi:hypothetical protein
LLHLALVAPKPREAHGGGGTTPRLGNRKLRRVESGH